MLKPSPSLLLPVAYSLARSRSPPERLQRFFRAIASSDTEAIDKLACLVVEDERKKGHTLLAEQLENIMVIVKNSAVSL